MTAKKWGESFLKSGMPLEHLTHATLKADGWLCHPEREIERPNKTGEPTWFSIDLEATHPKANRDTALTLLVECKYHDTSRFWFFLPHEPYRWHFDDRFLNIGPYNTIKNPHSTRFLKLAPTSSGGIVVSNSGDRQDNAVYTALQQLVNAFFPHCLRTLFRHNLDFENTFDDERLYKPNCEGVVPVIVTNATIYRLKPEITDLQVIADAKDPSDIADELEWTWLYYDGNNQLFDQNLDAATKHITEESRYVHRFPFLEQSIYEYASRPNWIAVINIKSLQKATKSIFECFKTAKLLSVEHFISAPQPKIRKK